MGLTPIGADILYGGIILWYEVVPFGEWKFLIATIVGEINEVRNANFSLKTSYVEAILQK